MHLGGFGSSCMVVMGLFSRRGIWKKFWLRRFMISGSSVFVCWCILQGGLYVFVHLVLQNKCAAILSAFLIVGIGFL
jgi:hypothetical protein